MAKLAKSKPTSVAHIERFTKKVNAVRQAVAALPEDDWYDNLINIIHHPGWTTIAEGMFFDSLADSILAQTQQLAQLHQQLQAASEAVGQE